MSSLKEDMAKPYRPPPESQRDSHGSREPSVVMSSLSESSTQSSLQSSLLSTSGLHIGDEVPNTKYSNTPTELVSSLVDNQHSLQRKKERKCTNNEVKVRRSEERSSDELITN